MKKIKNLILLALCVITAQTAQAQAQVRTQSAQQVIDALTANGGHCQTIYYSASYQKDGCRYENGNYSNNMWIKDSYGIAHFEQRNPDYIDWVTYDGDPGIKAKEVTLVDAFGGLFDWDFVISEDGANNMAQNVDKLYQAKGAGNEHKYVRLFVMSPTETDWFSNIPVQRTTLEDISAPYQAHIWLSQADIKNLESLGVTPWGHTNFDQSITLTPYWGLRSNFLRLAVINDGKDGIRGNDDDVEEFNYDFLYAEFRHYNPNTTIGDKLNGTNRTFAAISNLDQDKNFRIYNFSNFGPSFTQPKGSGQGYGEGLNAEISPIVGQLFPNHTLLIERQPGYVHYNRAYESGSNPYDFSITKWDDCWTAGVVTDAQGNYDRDNLLLKEDITGTWEGVDPHHHHMSDVDAQATNPWVTDGGTCRSREQVTLHIDPYVYCTDAQLDQDQYDTDDEHGRGGIYELVTANVEADITLQLAITNDIAADLIRVEGDDPTTGKRKDRLACPIEFDVTANEQYVDHYEVYIHERNGGPEVTDASDAAFADASSNINDAMNNTVAKYVVNKGSNDPNATGEASHYEAYVKSGYDENTNTPTFSKVMLFELPEGTAPVTVTVYVKAVYTEESGLAPTYHSLKNIHVQRDAIPTGVKDVNIAGDAVKAYKTVENGQIVIVRGNQRFNIMGQPIR